MILHGDESGAGPLCPESARVRSRNYQWVPTFKVRIPSYPFNPKIDYGFIDEPVHAFGHLEILEKIRALRWYYDNDTVERASNVHLSLRRWLGYAGDRSHY